jgi:hypothetical protein
VAVIAFRCTVCGAALRADAAQAGRNAKCKGCGQVVTIPGGSPQKPTSTPQRRSPQKPTLVPKAGSTAPPAAGPLPPTEEYKPPAEGVTPTPAREETGRKTGKRRRRAEEDEPETGNEDRPRRATAELAAWRKVSLGMALILVPIGIAVLSSLSGLIGSLPIPIFNKAALALYATPAGFVVISVVAVVPGLASVVGFALCSFVPRQFASRTLPLVAMVLSFLINGTGAGMLLMSRSMYQKVASQVSTDGTIHFEPAKLDQRLSPEDVLQKVQLDLEGVMRTARTISFVTHLVLLLGGAQSMVFLYFLAQLARGLEDTTTAANCESLLRLTAGLLVAEIAMVLFSGLVVTAAGAAAFVTTLLAIVSTILKFVWLGQEVWFVLVLVAVRGLVAAKARRRRRKKRAGPAGAAAG